MKSALVVSERSSSPSFGDGPTTQIAFVKHESVR
jgi:hypothetical protein